jgi:hypothetical protein
MAKSGDSNSSKGKVRRYRDRLRRQGHRPIQIWVPDVRAPGFRTQAHLQSLAVAQSPQAEEDQAFIDAVSDFARSLSSWAWRVHPGARRVFESPILPVPPVTR